MLVNEEKNWQALLTLYYHSSNGFIKGGGKEIYYQYSVHVRKSQPAFSQLHSRDIWGMDKTPFLPWKRTFEMRMIDALSQLYLCVCRTNRDVNYHTSAMRMLWFGCRFTFFLDLGGKWRRKEERSRGNRQKQGVQGGAFWAFVRVKS